MASSFHDKYIHQIYLQSGYVLTNDNHSWKNHNPTYTYILWNETSITDLMKNNNLIDFYLALSKWPSRLDFAKCVILYYYGGIYADNDTKCLKSFDTLINQYDDFDIIVSETDINLQSSFVNKLYNLDTSTIIINTGVIIAKKYNSFLKYAIHNMSQNNIPITNNYINIDILGPIALSRYIDLYNDNKRIIILNHKIFESPEILNESYSIHHHTKTWDENHDIDLVIKASSKYNMYCGSILILLVVGILTIYYYLINKYQIDTNIYFVVSIMMSLIIYWIMDNIYIKYYHNNLNTKVKQYVIDNDRFYDIKQFAIFNKIRSQWKNIAIEAQNVYSNAPISESIKRDYGQWKNLDNDFSKKVINNYGWIKAWSDPNNNRKKDGNDKWLNYGLYHYGKWFEENTKKCPITYSLLNEIKDHINIAGFSLMKGISKIDKHKDTTGKSTNSLAYHLGLIVPDPPNSCILNVDGYEISQKNGQDIIFDSNYEHYAKNDSSYDRIILYIDFKLS